MVALAVGEVLQGFQLRRREEVRELQVEVWLLEHQQSGARLIYMPAADENKVFAIAFATPPADDRGISHILEHSVLCGSRKYPLKEPFVDLAKGSLNTFLNAITYPDFTAYPLASCNSKDFRNLMDVYLDAVFYPLIYQNPYTLLQEGWHYEIAGPEEPLRYNGVVYNEMKGVYSSPDAYLERATVQALFPDSPARFESGGLPQAIPELTQEDFLAYHRRYYHPDNAYLLLYGDMDLEETLAYLDREYLGAFRRRGEPRPQVVWQQPLERTAEVRATYPSQAGEEAATFLQLSIVCGRSSDNKLVQTLRLLQGALVDKEGSPLRQALQQAGIGQSISASLDTVHPQCTFSITASGCREEQRDAFLSTIYRTLQELTIKGLDRERLAALLDATDFRLREADFSPYPKGLCLGLTALGRVLSGGDPIQALRFEELVGELRAAIDSDYYTKFIEAHLLDNTHRALITLVPEPGQGEAEAAALAQELAQRKAALSPEQLADWIQRCQELRRRQGEPDREEAKAAIPSLGRGDIRRSIRQLQVEEGAVGTDRFYYLPQHTNGIVYLRLYFHCPSLTFSLLPYCYLLSELLGRFDTGSYSYQELPTLVYANAGNLGFGFGPHSQVEDGDDFKLYSNVATKALAAKLPKLLELIREILTGSRFTDLDHFRTLLEDLKRGWDDSVFADGRSHARSRLYSYFSASGLCSEQGGLVYYNLLKELVADFPTRGPQALATLAGLLPQLFHQGRCSVFYSCQEEDRDQVARLLQDFLAQLPPAPPAVPFQLPPLEAKNEGFLSNGRVQYVLAGGSYRQAGYSFHGSMAVLETLLSYDYLWTKVRVQGGAYGAGASFEQGGTCSFSSYRDPQLGATLAAYQGLPAYLAGLELSPRELDRCVIGTMSLVDKPCTNGENLDLVTTYQLRGITAALRQRNRDQILDVSLEELRALAPVVQAVLEQRQLCVIGSRQAILQEEALFKNLVEL